MSAAFTREDMTDAIAEAISGSFDADWNSHDGAAAVVRDCGVWELYEVVSEWLTVGNDLKARKAIRDKARAVLAKARGEQQ